MPQISLKMQNNAHMPRAHLMEFVHEASQLCLAALATLVVRTDSIEWARKQFIAHIAVVHVVLPYIRLR